MRRRVKWNNELATLPRYEELASLAKALREPATTEELGRRAGLEDDKHGVTGALLMLEALGVVHATPGNRKARVWRAGKRTGDRPPTLPPLLPYQRLVKLLKWFGQTPIGTRPALFDVHLGHPSQRNAASERKLRGALKALAALDLVSYDTATNGWFWRDAKARRPYRPGLFGLPEGLVERVEYDEENLTSP